MNKINIILPTNNPLTEISKNFIKLKKTEPEYFYENIEKVSFFGCFPYCIWALAEQEKQYHSKEDIQYIVQFIVDNNSAIYLDFLNTQLKREHFYDSYSNLILSTVKEVEIHAFTSNKDLKKYINENYPYVDTNTEKIVQLNSYCDNCKECFEKKSNDKINFEKPQLYLCEREVNTFEESKNRDDFISNEKIKILAEQGITDFIIKEQTKDKYEFIESCLYYLIKPEYQNIVRLKVLKESVKSK